MLRTGKRLILANVAENESPSAPTPRLSSLRSAVRSASPAPASEATPQTAQSRPRRARATPASPVSHHLRRSWGLQQYEMLAG